MVNILVVEDDVIQSKQIINYISQKNKNIKLYGMTDSGEETLNLLLSEEIDIIILDLKLTGINGVEIIKTIERKNMERYKNSIIIVSGEEDMIKEVNASPYVYRYFFKAVDMCDINETINNMIQEKKYTDIIREKIANELSKLDFNFTHEGTNYLLECIYQVYKMKIIDNMNLSKTIYPIVARKYKKSQNTIYGDIKQAINAMFNTCSKEALKEYFNYNFLIKPRPKEIIYTILNKISD